MSFVTDLGLSCTLTPVAVNGPHVMLSFKSTCLVRFVAERVGSLYYLKNICNYESYNIGGSFNFGGNPALSLRATSTQTRCSFYLAARLCVVEEPKIADSIAAFIIVIILQLSRNLYTNFEYNI